MGRTIGQLSRGERYLLSLLATCAIVSPTAAWGQTPTVQLAQTVTYPILQQGSGGETVRRLQATLNLMGFYQGPIDGTFNEATTAAVSSFQSAAGLSPDGVVGPATWQKLLPRPGDTVTAAVPPASSVVAPEPATEVAEEPAAPTGPPILRPDVEGPAVAQLQRELQILEYYDGPIDGIYGEQTQAAVRQFQTDQQLEVDAIVGPSTWDALTRALG
ncbi:MAG: peptidoglycan-binding protein [Cyanobacteria bacterium J06581_3]